MIAQYGRVHLEHARNTLSLLSVKLTQSADSGNLLNLIWTVKDNGMLSEKLLSQGTLQSLSYEDCLPTHVRQGLGIQTRLPSQLTMGPRLVLNSVFSLQKEKLKLGRQTMWYGQSQVREPKVGSQV